MTATTKTTKVDGEYRVRLFIDGIYQAGADYFTDCKEDMQITSKLMQDRAGQSDKTTQVAKDEQEEYNQLQGDNMTTLAKNDNKTHQQEQSEQVRYSSQIVVIISAEQYRKNDTFNQDQTDALERTLSYEGFTFSKALGCYKGTSEKSFVVVVKTASQLQSLKVLARDFKQESILIRDGNRVDLYYPATPKYENIGSELKQVPRKLAKVQDAYTFVNDCYYIVK